MELYLILGEHSVAVVEPISKGTILQKVNTFRTLYRQYIWTRATPYLEQINNKYKELFLLNRDYQDLELVFNNIPIEVEVWVEKTSKIVLDDLLETKECLGIGVLTNSKAEVENTITKMRQHKF